MTPQNPHVFTYELLSQPGKARATYVVDGVENEFELTNVCNPLGDMLSTLATMVSNPTHLWGEVNTGAFTWFCEDESYNWTLRLGENRRVEIRITQSCEFFGDDEIEVLSGTYNFMDFLSAIVETLDSFIKRIGLLNYWQHWRGSEFPITFLLFLKKFLIENDNWQPNEAPQDDMALSHEWGILTEAWGRQPH